MSKLTLNFKLYRLICELQLFFSNITHGSLIRHGMIIEDYYERCTPKYIQSEFFTEEQV